VSRGRNILSVLAVIAASSLLAAPAASATSCPNTEVQVSSLSQADMETSIGCLINENRAAAGLQPVQPNTDLREAALSHSQEMVSQGYFEHTSPAGVTFIDRIQQYGYMQGTASWIVGENLVWGDRELSTPDALVTAWMNSPEHRANLLRPQFNEIGIAAVSGTPVDAKDTTGVTVSSEYGYRTFGNKASISKAHRHKSKSKLRKRHR
jgi:uncharacterized protein YkwD